MSIQVLCVLSLSLSLSLSQDFGVWDYAAVKSTKWTEPLKSGGGDFEPNLVHLPPAVAADVDGWIRAEELRICSSSNSQSQSQGQGHSNSNSKGSKQVATTNSPIVVVSTSKVGKREPKGKLCMYV